MVIDKSQVKRILVITLSNVGDIILTMPVIRTLSVEFPHTRIDVMAGPRGKELFEKDPAVFKLILYDKHMSLTDKRRLQLKLKRLRYDLVVDLKNTIFPLLIGPKYRTGTIQRFPKGIMHARSKHLHRLKSLGLSKIDEDYYIYIPPEDEIYITGLLKEENIAEPIVVVNPGAKSHLKRWTVEGFAKISDRLIEECGASVILVGLSEDRPIASDIIGRMKHKPHDFIQKTNIRQLASLLKRAKLLITNDSAPLHLGCAVGVKVLALFGPTDTRKYGPTGEFDIVVQKKLSCSPCESATCRFNYECMKLIAPEEVFDTAKVMIEGYG